MNKNFRTKLRSLRQSNLYWRYAANFAPTVEQLLRRHEQRNGQLTEIAHALKTDGVAITTAENLWSTEFLAEIDRATNDLLKVREKEIDAMRDRVDADRTIGQKTFNLEMLGSEPEFDEKSAFAKLSLSDPLLSIANTYLRMTAQLRYYNVWYTTASNGESRESQLWHYDREDNHILKVFLYLDDVNEGSGPFVYAPGTQRGGRNTSIDPEFVMEGRVRRTTDEQMEKVFPRENWKVCTGKKGTLVFADTRGYHKGGEARTGNRVMFTCMYTSPASESKKLLRFRNDFDPESFSPEQLRALRRRGK